MQKPLKDTYTMQNRHGHDIEVITHTVSNPRGTVFVHHGYPGAAHSPTIDLMRQTFNALGLNTITPNTTNNYNNSHGDLKDMTLAGHTDDLEDVIRHAITTDSFTGPIAITGHSAGGHSALVVSSRFKGLERSVLTIASAPVITGQSFINAWSEMIGPEEAAAWKTNGYCIGGSDAGPDQLKMHWDVYQEWATHDLARDKIRPENHTVLIHPHDDPFIPEADMIRYLEATRIDEFHSIRDADHCYTGKEQETAFVASLARAIDKRFPSP